MGLYILEKLLFSIREPQETLIIPCRSGATTEKMVPQNFMAGQNIICMNCMHCITIFHEQEHLGENSKWSFFTQKLRTLGVHHWAISTMIIRPESREHWKQQPPVTFRYIVFFVLGILIYWLVVLNNWNWGPVSHPRIWPPNQGFDHRNQVLPTSDHIQSPGRHRFRPATSRGFTRGRPPRNGWK